MDCQETIVHSWKLLFISLDGHAGYRDDMIIVEAEAKAVRVAVPTNVACI